MVTNEDVFNLAFYDCGKPFTGSSKNIRYRILMKKEEVEGEKSPRKIFQAWVWKDVKCFEETPEDEKVKREFPFTEDGKKEVVEWINEMEGEFL